MPRRIALVLIALLVALPILAWGGFQIWLRTVPPEFRAQIEQFSTWQFIGIVRETISPPPFADRGGFGRRIYEGRGDSPWVRRSALDGRPRMLAAALGPEQWIAYSTETGALHQFWRGDIDYTGPVFDAAHGFEPTSRGEAYLRPSTGPAWSIEWQGELHPAHVQWIAHGFDPGSGGLWLRYRLRPPADLMAAAMARGEATDAAHERIVTEWPELAGAAPLPAATLSRRFAFSPGPALTLDLSTTDGLRMEGASPTPASGAGSGRVRIAEGIREAHLVQTFDAPRLALDEAPPPDTPVGDPFAEHDCYSCHNERERVVGPAWSEVALRYAGANRGITEKQLARRIREGGVGVWGDVPMTAHPELSGTEAIQLARIILDTPPSEPPARVTEDDGSEATWTFETDTEPAPAGLHPTLSTRPVDVPGFTPKVGGLAWRADGALAVSTWDRDGAVFAVHGLLDASRPVEVERIAEGLHEPLGLAAQGDRLFVMQKQEITELLDHDGDGWTDEYRTISNDWAVTSNFHEFGFGLLARGDELFATLGVCVLTGGKSCRQQTADRGTLIRVSLESGRAFRLASGFRTPNGIGFAADRGILLADNQGDWLPSSKLIHIAPGADPDRDPGPDDTPDHTANSTPDHTRDYTPDYGWRAPGDLRTQDGVTPPTLWLPQNEIGNSPTQPLSLSSGPYAGQVVFGDIYNGGLKRATLEEVGGTLQGAAFHFSGGFQAPINRLISTPGGGFVVGQVGSRGNWGEPGKAWFGLEVVEMGDRPAFEPLRVEARTDGFDVVFTRPLADDVEPEAADFLARDWYYVPSEIYGGPKYGLRDLEVASVVLSPDRTRLTLVLPDLLAERIVYLRLDPRLRSAEGERLWVTEAWYTLNQLPARDQRVVSLDPASAARPDVAAGPATPSAPRGSSSELASEAPPNTLTEAERAAGWRLLFDGHSFAGWKIYGHEDDEIEHWTIEDEALHFTRDVSIAGLIWNHVNPFTPGAVDLMTRERFADFELRIDWRISEGGNSGIFYAIPNEDTPLSWDYALEMQVLDDATHYDGEIDRHRAGDLYDLQSLSRNAARPVGEWNTARIRVEGPRVRHWLNDQLVADLVRGSPEWNAALAASKFEGKEGFGLAREGHIALQDHGDLVWYRNVKILPLEPSASAD